MTGKFRTKSKMSHTNTLDLDTLVPPMLLRQQTITAFPVTATNGDSMHLRPLDWFNYLSKYGTIRISDRLIKSAQEFLMNFTPLTRVEVVDRRDSCSACYLEMIEHHSDMFDAASGAGVGASAEPSYDAIHMGGTGNKEISNRVLFAR